MRTSLLAFALLTASVPALAYIGPGMGAGLIATALGVIASAFLAIVAILYYPIKRMLRNRRLARDDSPSAAGHGAKS